MDLHVNAPEESALVSQASVMLELVTGLTIDSPALYEMAAGELQSIKKKAKELDDSRKEITRPLDAAKRRIMDLYERPLTILAQAEKLLKGAMAAYHAEQERKRIAEQRERDEEARKVREAQETEARRMQEEAAANAAKADELAAAGNIAAAADLADHAAEQLHAAHETAAVAAMVVAAPVVVDTPKVSGVSFRDHWTVDVLDKMALIRFIAGNEHFAHLLDANAGALQKLAAAQKESFAIPGCKANCEKILASRRAA